MTASLGTSFLVFLNQSPGFRTSLSLEVQAALWACRLVVHALPARMQSTGSPCAAVRREAGRTPRAGSEALFLRARAAQPREVGGAGGSPT